ncbi:truncated CRISPR-associated protein [Hydrogenobacter thermophilus TK-6]|uniref:Truncated CRISPR-associated protein n=2 Tax=Hydrogenobacter thermophilus TaxID=940 RepID=D3DK26_HYDTT|nr:truncated CRISPR-associated protein [Hydrogenobacter thermophilus TK-6]
MNFFRLNVIVHIVGEEQLLRTFKGALERPSVFLSLGGGEYPALVKNKLHRKGDIPS